ncbi:hypothetical protein DERP_009880 [Dermatophagoides pteronyssinus]|uniref:Uncharacterized protein n=1 Tax=Dermatophagoides pteronyssinus TaxID=6956 RepID=A0ABQ8J1X5_DERPT|nr:hypothetical protein DERP_009880 [Dermatophagoides pteronyssinus]
MFRDQLIHKRFALVKYIQITKLPPPPIPKPFCEPCADLMAKFIRCDDDDGLRDKDDTCC